MQRQQSRQLQRMMRMTACCQGGPLLKLCKHGMQPAHLLLQGRHLSQPRHSRQQEKPCSPSACQMLQVQHLRYRLLLQQQQQLLLQAKHSKGPDQVMLVRRLNYLSITGSGSGIQSISSISSSRCRLHRLIPQAGSVGAGGSVWRC